MTPANLTTSVENERQYRVVDQMLTMHSLLRDRMERRAFWLNTALIGSSLFLCVFSFVGDDVLGALKFDPSMTRFDLGLVAVVVLLISITEFRVDWRTVSGKHAEAVARLAALKAKYRKSFSETGGNDPNKNKRLTSEYEKVMNGLPAIPDRWFGKLKAEHRFKRLVSERINHSPRSPIWWVSFLLRMEGKESRNAEPKIENKTT
jgi:hypothetical protein